MRQRERKLESKCFVRRGDQETRRNERSGLLIVSIITWWLGLKNWLLILSHGLELIVGDSK